MSEIVVKQKERAAIDGLELEYELTKPGLRRGRAGYLVLVVVLELALGV